MREEELLKKAKKRVAAIKGFYAHLITYFFTIIFLFVINFMTSPNYWWFVFPAAGWGLGLIFHYFGVFGFTSWQGKDWEARTLHREMDRLRRQSPTEVYEEDDTLDLEDEPLELKEKVKQKRDYDDRDLV